MSQNCGGNKYTFRFLSRLLFWTSEPNDFPHDREKTLKSKTVFFIILGISSIILGKCGGIVEFVDEKVTLKSQVFSSKTNLTVTTLCACA